MTRSPARSVVIIAAAALVVLGVVLPSTAHASLGDGFAMGPTRLHLGVETDLMYNSEAGAGVYLGTSGSPISNPGDLIGIFRALVALEGKSENFKLNLQGDVNWNQYAGLLAGTQGLSYLGANLAGTLHANPEGRFGVDITEMFSRTNLTTNPVFGLGVLGLVDDTKLRLRFRPGGGAIEFGVGAEFGVALYSPQLPETGTTMYPQCGSNGGTVPPGCDPGLASAYNQYNVAGTIDARWRFLPKTGITLDASIGTQQYVYGQGSASEAVVPNLNAMPYSVLLGFGTLLSSRFSFTLKAGYQGITFAQNVQDNYGTFAGLADVGFHISELVSTRVGYTRNILPVGGIDHWFGDNRIFWELTLTPTQKVNVYALASVDFITYGGPEGRTDDAYGVSARCEYSFLKWLKLIGKVDVASRSSVSALAITSSGDAAYNYTLVDVSAGLAALF